jgi:type I restriction enzyme S subunit
MRAANVTWNGISLDDVKEMDFSPKEFEIYQLREGDILLSEASGSASEVGKPALWRGDVPDCCFQNTLIRVRTKGPLAEYLHLHFMADARLGKFAAAGKGVGINHLGADRMSSWPTMVPPLNEQRRIVAKLETLQARSRRARAALEAVPPLLEKLRQSILASAFRGDLTKDWRAKHPDVEPATALLQRIRVERRKKWEAAELEKMRAKGRLPGDDRWKEKYKEPEPVDATGLPELPKGWCWASLEALTDPERGIPYGIVLTGDPVGNGVPTVRCGDIKNFNIDIPNLKRVDPRVAEEFVRTTLRGNEILIAIRGTVGATAVASEEMRGMNISREVAMIPTLDALNPEYLMLCLAGPEAQARVMKRVKGVAQAGINLADLRILPVPVTSAEEQLLVRTRIEEKLRACQTTADATTALVRRSMGLDRSLLAKAFRGELVPQDPNDEPAEAMLARLSSSTDTQAQPRRAPRKSKP